MFWLFCSYRLLVSGKHLKIPIRKGFPEAIEINFLTEVGLLPVLENHPLLIEALNISKDRALYLCLISLYLPPSLKEEFYPNKINLSLLSTYLLCLCHLPKEYVNISYKDESNL